VIVISGVRTEDNKSRRQGKKKSKDKKEKRYVIRRDKGVLIGNEVESSSDPRQGTEASYYGILSSREDAAVMFLMITEQQACSRALKPRWP
jgi:hypothetical protein